MRTSAFQRLPHLSRRFPSRCAPGVRQAALCSLHADHAMSAKRASCATALPIAHLVQLHETEWIMLSMESCKIAVRLIPRARVNEISGDRSGVLLVRVTAPPVDGKANAALCRLIAKR